MLNGKVVLVTGSNKGIGLEIVRIFLKSGATVVANYREKHDNLDRLLDEFGEKIILIKANISKSEEVKTLFSELKNRCKRLDVLVNNAGILKDNLLMMSKEEDFDCIIGTNLKGVFLCMQQAAKMMMRSGGSIVNISSIVGIGGNAGQCIYSASKAGVIGLTKSAAKEMGQFNIRVNAIAPGVIKTDMIAHLNDEKIGDFIKNTPLKKLGRPEDVVETALFLASDSASFINGQVIEVSGGLVI
jgi:3-oxoacyl-[acyl-carrier protein] reductase